MNSTKPIIEVLSPFNMHEPIHRMKIASLMALPDSEFSFRDYVYSEGGSDGVLINCLHLDLIENPEFIRSLAARAVDKVVMLMMADFYPTSVDYLRKWSEFVDIFLVPTPEMRDFIQIFTSRKVQVLIDPIDFGLIKSEKVRSQRSDRIKVVWFGYPESYTKSMRLFEGTLAEMHQSGEIEFHLISKNDTYGEGRSGFIHEYDPETFLDLLSNFDVCVLSHLPFDFSISTQWKSENKAVLAINRGLPVVASKTPSYSRLLSRCGVEKFSFSTAEELTSSIRLLKSADERAKYLVACQDIILRQFSIKKMSKDLSEIFHAQLLLKQAVTPTT